MPTKVRVKVDAAKEMPGGTLRFPTRKKRLEDVRKGISRIRRCLELRLSPAILVTFVENNFGVDYALL